jgi:chorismate mutase
MGLEIHKNWLKEIAPQGQPLVIAGPCSAESLDQILETAKALKQIAQVSYFRAGIWKPRTRPNSFEGTGEAALEWLSEVKKITGMKTAIEVATPQHVELALKNNIDLLWIGARTTAGPFAVQEIATALKGCNVTVLVKNPVNAELALWIGALERIANAGIQQLGAIHRGFSGIENGIYRNVPLWNQPIELKRRFPNIPIICDPSHIAGKRAYVEEVCQMALDLAMDGLMIEVHPRPDEAWSDAAQQITPKELYTLLSRIVQKNEITSDHTFEDNLEYWRGQIDRIDDELLTFLKARMQISNQIGIAKSNQKVTVLQSNRWQQLLALRMTKAQELGLSSEFVEKMFTLIHEESVRIQSTTLRKDKG